MTYTAWSVTFGEQPSAAKWNQLGTNDAGFRTGGNFPNGAVVQVVGNATTAVATGTTLIPMDDSIPQSGEGDEYMTQAITPKSASNVLVITANLVCSSSSAVADYIAALFQDATAGALAATTEYIGTATAIQNLKLVHIMTAGTTSSTTFKIRAGGSQAGTFTFNGQGGARRFGAITKSSLHILEYKGADF